MLPERRLFRQKMSLYGKGVKVGGIFPLDEYEKYGLQDFEPDDGVPITLKAMLFNRYHSSNGFYLNIADMFKEWYVRFYLCEDNE